MSAASGLLQSTNVLGINSMGSNKQEVSVQDSRVNNTVLSQLGNITAGNSTAQKMEDPRKRAMSLN